MGLFFKTSFSSLPFKETESHESRTTENWLRVQDSLSKRVQWFKRPSSNKAERFLFPLNMQHFVDWANSPSSVGAASLFLDIQTNRKGESCVR